MEHAFKSSFEKATQVSPEFLQLLEDRPSPESQQEQRSALQEHDARFDHFTKYDELLQKWASRYGVNVEIRKNEEGMIEVPFVGLPDNVPALPEGYGYKGGAARAILQHGLGLEPAEPRDLDIVFVGENEDRELTDQLSEQYMPDDYAHGYGVERLEDDYFKSRDFTMNEVLFDGEKVICTRHCLTDMLRNIVRFSKYEEPHYDEEDGRIYVNDKLMAKAVRMVADAQVCGQEKARIAGEDDELQEVYIEDFHLALHLDRAMEQGKKVADKYLEIMQDRGYISGDFASLEEAVDYLSQYTNFYFRSDLESVLRGEQEMFSDNPAVFDDWHVDDQYDHVVSGQVPFWKSV